MRSSRRFASLAGALAAALLTACSGSSSSGSGGSSGTSNALPAPKGITPNVVPSPNLGAGQLLLSASGEVLSLDGFDWPPMGSGDTCMVDGWQFTLHRYLTVLADVTLWSTPNLVPSDQSQHGPVVAHVAGPWVIDLHKGGVLIGKGGGGEQAAPFGQIVAQDDGSAFDPTVTYGFGFSTIAATEDVYNVNLDSKPGPDGISDLDAYEKIMIPNGYSVLYTGVATYVGAAPGTPSCDAVTWGTPAQTYDFTKLPKTIPFQLGFKTPTNYVNCQNGTDIQGPGVNGEDHPRGIQFLTTEQAIAQITIHMDHPFWESFAESSPLHWDQIAARYRDIEKPLARTEDMKGVDFTAFTDRDGSAVPWRTCDPGYYMPSGTGQLGFDPLHVSVTLGGSDPTKGLRDYYDYLQYTQSTQGHLNSRGICFISRQYPSPPGGSG